MLLEKLAGKILNDAISAVGIEKVKQILKDSGDSLVQMIGEDINNYKGKFRSKYSVTKTFIHRNVQIELEKVYYPLDLLWKKTSLKIDDNINQLFRIYRRKIAIIGTAGQGKTIIVRHIFMKALDNNLKIPVMIELRRLNKGNKTLTRYINHIISDFKVAQNQKIFEKMLEEGQFLFIFDGYDEIETNHRDDVTEEILDISSKYPRNYFILTARPGAGAEYLSQYDVMKIDELASTDIEHFINQQFNLIPDTGNLNNQLINEINKKENKIYKEYLSNPLLLSMLIYTFRYKPELPKKKKDFYENIFEVLLFQHSAIDNEGHVREKLSGLDEDQFKKVLQWFSCISYFERKYNFTYSYLNTTLTNICKQNKIKCNTKNLIQDLQVAICILVQDGSEYSFPHRSMQEYFVANFVSECGSINQIKKFYEILTKRKNIWDANFWSLLLEMDYINCNKEFFIPQLQLFQSLLSEKIKTFEENNKSFIITTNYIKYFHLLFENKQIKLDEEKDKILTFLEIEKPQIKYKKEWESILGDLFILSGSEDEFQERINTDYNILVSFFNQSGLTKYCEGLLKKIINKINEIDKECDNIEKSTFDLFDVLD